MEQPEEEKESQTARKEATKKKREEILKKFESKRHAYIKKNLDETLNRESSFKQDDNDTVECAVCKEILSLETFASHPYGQFAYISKTKLMWHTLK